jgi:hypothetical protein
MAASPTGPTLPYEPEPVASMQARFTLAIDPIIAVERVWAGLDPRPGEQRRHVFDFEDGLRLIVSRETYPTDSSIGIRLSGRTGIHLSGSAAGAMQSAIRRGEIDRMTFMDLMLRRFREIAQRPSAHFELAGFSDRGVPHLMEWEGV